MRLFRNHCRGNKRYDVPGTTGFACEKVGTDKLMKLFNPLQPN